MKTYLCDVILKTKDTEIRHLVVYANSYYEVMREIELRYAHSDIRKLYIEERREYAYGKVFDFDRNEDVKAFLESAGRARQAERNNDKDYTF